MRVMRWKMIMLTLTYEVDVGLPGEGSTVAQGVGRLNRCDRPLLEGGAES